jgi:hypothetical protein
MRSNGSRAAIANKVHRKLQPERLSGVLYLIQTL